MLIPGNTLIKNGSSFPPPRLFLAPRLFERDECLNFEIQVKQIMLSILFFHYICNSDFVLLKKKTHTLSVSCLRLARHAWYTRCTSMPLSKPFSIQFAFFNFVLTKCVIYKEDLIQFVKTSIIAPLYESLSYKNLCINGCYRTMQREIL